MLEKPVRLFAPIDFRTRFPALDGIRALAIVAVFADHYGGGSHGGRILILLNRVRSFGWLGVDLFFVLSGFLITGILFDTLGDSKYFRRFFARRSLRIFPVYYLVFAILLVLTPYAGYVWKPGHLLFLAYLGNFLGNYNFDYYAIQATHHPMMVAGISHFWSLCVEEQFYLLWPLAVFFLRKRRSLMTAGVALCALALVLRIAMYHFGGPELAERWIVRTLPFRMDSLIMGGLLALLLRGGHADAVQRSCKWLLLGGSAIAASILLLTPYNSFLALTFSSTFVAIACVGLIGTTLRINGPAFRLFNLKPLRTLGKYSYGFYIFHLIFRWEWITFLVYLGTKLHSLALAGIVALSVNFVVTFLAAKFSYDFFESRFLRYKKHFEYDSEVQSHRHAFVTE